MFKSMRKEFKKNSNSIVAGLDLGTSKVYCAITRQESSNNFRIVGMCCQASKGIKGGLIYDMELLQTAVAEAIYQAEEQADDRIKEIYVSVSPALCYSKIVNVELDISNQCIDGAHIKKLEQSAIQSLEVASHLMIHSVPLNYELDEIKHINDPRGMFGEVLRAKIHLLFASKTLLRNLSACVERCHLEVAGFITSPYATGMSTLVEDELDLGVTLIDIGAGTTTIGLFYNNKLAHVDYIPLGGGNITNDIARVLSTPLVNAERLKTLYGSVMASSGDMRELITVPQIGDIEGKRNIEINKNELTQIIRPRVEEILDQVRIKLNNCPVSKYTGKRLVLTGGCSQLSGIGEMVSVILDKQVRIAYPLHQHGIPEALKLPGFATCAGLLNYGKIQKGPELAIYNHNDNDKKTFIKQVNGWFSSKV